MRLTRVNCTASARPREFHAQTVKINWRGKMHYVCRVFSAAVVYLFRFDRIPCDATDTQTAVFAFSTKVLHPKISIQFFFFEIGRERNFELSNIFPDEGLILGFNSEKQSHNGARRFFLAILEIISA